jgi:hypothetical protein
VHQALPAQRQHRCAGASGAAANIRDREGLIGPAQHLQHGCLFGRELRLLGLFLERLADLLGNQQEGSNPGAGLVANSRRHRCIQSLTPRANVVLGHPARQLEHLRVDERNGVEHFDHFLQLARIQTLRRRRIDAHAITDRQPVAPPQRHTETLPRTDGPARPRGSPIREHLLDRPVDDHPHEGPLGGLFGLVLEPEPSGLNFVGTGSFALGITIDHD